MEQHIAKLAAILEQHGLTHLEYETDDSRVVLDKEVAPAIQMQAPLVAGAPAVALTSAAASPLPPASATANHAFASAENAAAAANAAIASPSSPSPASDSVDVSSGELITAPLVGIAYSAKEPGAAPFVAVGDKVEEGTVLCLIEAMKMFNEVKAPASGRITKVHFEDAALVEYGAPLFTLDSSS
jgi:acetyl-CoA carboxylase biotin carboxyl carrier protein